MRVVSNSGPTPLRLLAEMNAAHTTGVFIRQSWGDSTHPAVAASPAPAGRLAAFRHARPENFARLASFFRGSARTGTAHLPRRISHHLRSLARRGLRVLLSCRHTRDRRRHRPRRPVLIQPASRPCVPCLCSHAGMRCPSCSRPCVDCATQGEAADRRACVVA
jgi:hypothetical protein